MLAGMMASLCGWMECGWAEERQAEPPRPKIGLALGGGGALGLAHIGVLKTLEEMRIPIDYIAGTSMGSIIGGLYASGLSPEFIEAEMAAIDWWDVMKDQTNRRELDFRRKRDDSRYIMDLELGLQGARLIFPHGLATGQKLNTLIARYTVNSVSAKTFDDLNIPFRCVATDLRSGKPVVLDQGNLATAIRASMAIPGAFTPVDGDEYILMDGGWSDNVPVDVVRAMGADIVIAVDVGYMQAEAGKTNTFETLGQILSRTYDIMQRPNSDPQTRSADIAILPELQDYSASDFPKVMEFVPKGTEAALARSDELKKLAVDEAAYQAWRTHQRSARVEHIRLAAVSVEGNQRVSTAVIKGRIQSKPGAPADFTTLNQDISLIYGMGDFQTVGYSLDPLPDGEYALRLLTREKYWGPGYVHFGLRMDSDFSGNSYWALLLNYTRRPINAWHGEVSLDLKGGQAQEARLEWYQPIQSKGLYFFSPALCAATRREGYYEGDQRVAEFDRKERSVNLDAGLALKQYGELRMGLYRGDLRADVRTGQVPSTNLNNNVGALTAGFTIDRLDNKAFFKKGYYLALDGFFALEDLGSTRDYQKVRAIGRTAINTGVHTVQVALQGGTCFGSDVPFYDQFTVGGMSSLIGLDFGQLRGNYFGAGRVLYLLQIGRLSPTLGDGIYLVGIGDVGNAWQLRDEVSWDDLTYGFGGGLAADTVLGPLFLAAGRAERDEMKYYFSVGYGF